MSADSSLGARLMAKRRRAASSAVPSAEAHQHPGGLPLSSLTNVAAYTVEGWMELFRDLGSYSFSHHIFGSDHPPFVHRKGWEWTQTIWGFDQLGMLESHHRAIGVGCGTECVVFWLGDRLAEVVATDLYGNEKWSQLGGREADPSVVDDPQTFCPRPIRRDAIEFRVADGTDLGEFPDGSFDLAWSLSSIEHFGSHERAGDAVREMARVVRKNGVIAVATELLLLPDQTHPEYFSRAELEEHVLSASPALELIEPVEWFLPPVEYLVDSVVLPDMAYKTRRHVVLHDGHVQWTSVLVFFRKK